MEETTEGQVGSTLLLSFRSPRRVSTYTCVLSYTRLGCAIDFVPTAHTKKRKKTRITRAASRFEGSSILARVRDTGTLEEHIAARAKTRL